MSQLLWIAAGLFLALVLPRYRNALVLSFAAGLALVGSGTVLAWMQAPIIAVAAAMALVPAGALLLARRVPRLFSPLMVLVSWGVAHLSLEDAGSSRLWSYVVVGVGVALAVLALRVPLGVRASCSALAARLILLASPWSTRWAFLALVAVFLFASWLATTALDPDPPAWPTVCRLAASLAVVTFTAVMSTTLLARQVPPPTAEPYLSRWQRLSATAPHGGLIWPTLSSMSQVDPAGEWPWLESPDALYILGRPGGLVKLPGTSPTMGAFALRRPIARMRALKEPAELEDLRAAARATVAALKESLPRYRSGHGEAEISQAITEQFRAQGCERASFPPIVATGAHGASPHHFGKSALLQHGDLVVTDIGCSRNHYASDFTRTLPVGGKLRGRARELYEAVYAAQQAALAGCRPGAYLTGRGSPDGGSLDAISRATLRAYGVEDAYPHVIGHTVGLAVHDVMVPGPLQDGMVITLEPGIYLEGELGIRIEDTYLVTDGGCESLTDGFPADSASIERLMAEAFEPGDGGSPIGGTEAP